MSLILEGSSSEEESTSTSQNDNKMDSARPTLLLFDIDGVITEPVTGKVASDVVDEIVSILERGEPIAFNTGRGLKWVIQDIFPPIRHKLSSESMLSKLSIAYEKGAFLLTFNERGEPEKPVVTPEIDFVPLSLRMEVLELITTKYSATMFPGEEKEAILSPQFQPGSDFTKYKEDQERLVADLHGILQRSELDTQFRIDPTRIATDIEDIRLGKALGTRRILEWLTDRGIQSEYFIAFGDSKSDIGMAEEIHSHGFPVEMVFVGGKEQLKDIHLPFMVIFTQAHCEKGTAEYFRDKVQNDHR